MIRGLTTDDARRYGIELSHGEGLIRYWTLMANGKLRGLREFEDELSDEQVLDQCIAFANEKVAARRQEQAQERLAAEQAQRDRTDAAILAIRAGALRRRRGHGQQTPAQAKASLRK